MADTHEGLVISSLEALVMETELKNNLVTLPVEVVDEPRDHFKELAAQSEPGSLFDLMNQLGQALDKFDRLSRE